MPALVIRHANRMCAGSRRLDEPAGDRDSRPAIGKDDESTRSRGSWCHARTGSSRPLTPHGPLHDDPEGSQSARPRFPASSSAGSARLPTVNRRPVLLAGPKALVEALHDDRRSGPKYRDLGVRAPLAVDDPTHVSGLAVGAVADDPRTEYMLGTELRVAAELLASVSVDSAAPNDIGATPSETAKIDEARIGYGWAVREAFAAYTSSVLRPRALVVRHRPERDEDNTWATWTGAICGVRGGGPAHWTAGAPLAGWRPTAVASLADASMDASVIYELRD